MSRALTHNLRLRSIDVLTVSEAGNKALSDEAQLDFAYAERRVIYSANIGDFQRIHTEYLLAGKEHAGIILVTQQAFSVGEQARQLLNLFGTRTPETMKNTLKFLSKW